PTFSRIPASAAALAGKPVVSCETFTCVYGFVAPGNIEPLRYWRREQVADLKLLADALFAQGVNQILWHGMPFNGPGGRNEFYASVHVGPVPRRRLVRRRHLVRRPVRRLRLRGRRRPGRPPPPGPRRPHGDLETPPAPTGPRAAARLRGPAPRIGIAARGAPEPGRGRAAAGGGGG